MMVYNDLFAVCPGDTFNQGNQHSLASSAGMIRRGFRSMMETLRIFK